MSTVFKQNRPTDRPTDRTPNTAFASALILIVNVAEPRWRLDATSNKSIRLAKQQTCRCLSQTNERSKRDRRENTFDLRPPRNPRSTKIPIFTSQCCIYIYMFRYLNGIRVRDIQLDFEKNLIKFHRRIELPTFLLRTLLLFFVFVFPFSFEMGFLTYEWSNGRWRFNWKGVVVAPMSNSILNTQGIQSQK